MDWMNTVSLVVGVLGVVIGLFGFVVGVLGLVFAYWQWRRAKQQGNELIDFLLGLKAAPLDDKTEKQINDKIARLKL